MREIVLDTETTGLKANGGDRIIEVAALELINHVPTGKYYQTYINPRREVAPDAVKVSGITTEFLQDKPYFEDISQDFSVFIQDDPLIIHNAPFDIGFLNAEFARIGKAPFPMSRAIDTLKMARLKFPGAQNTLDALCKRFSIDLSKRTLHGALIDCQLLTEVYIELIGGRQKKLLLNEKNHEAMGSQDINIIKKKYDPRPHQPTEQEKQLHAAFLESIRKKA